MGKTLLTVFVSLVVSASAFADEVKCGAMRAGGTVTHYYLPILQDFKNYECKTLEGQCVYQKNGVETLYNDGIGHQPRAQAKCKYGYGNGSNCLTPCVSVAADRRFHKRGELLYFPTLKGTVCDGKVHDGIVRVDDVGGMIKGANRFDFYIGECRSIKSGVCFEPLGLPLQAKLNNEKFCVVDAQSRSSLVGDAPEISANRRWSQTYCHTASGLTYRETQVDKEGAMTGEILEREGQQILEIPKLKIVEKTHFTGDNPDAKSRYKVEFAENNRLLSTATAQESTTVFDTKIRVFRKDGKALAPGVQTLEETASCKDEWSYNK